MTTSEEEVERTVVAPDYDIVASQLDRFQSQLEEQIAAGNVHLTIDLEHVSMIDSKGLAVFAVCKKSLDTAGGSLVVRANNPDLARLFQITRLDRHFEVQSS